MTKAKLQKLHKLNDEIRSLIEDQKVPLYLIRDLMEASSKLELHNKYETINQDTVMKLSKLGFEYKTKGIGYVVMI